MEDLDTLVERQGTVTEMVYSLMGLLDNPWKKL